MSKTDGKKDGGLRRVEKSLDKNDGGFGLGQVRWGMGIGGPILSASTRKLKDVAGRQALFGQGQGQRGTLEW